MSASLYNLTALLAEHLVLKALLPQILDLVVTLLDALLLPQVVASLVLLQLDVMLVLFQ